MVSSISSTRTFLLPSLGPKLTNFELSVANLGQWSPLHTFRRCIISASTRSFKCSPFSFAYFNSFADFWSFYIISYSFSSFSSPSISIELSSPESSSSLLLLSELFLISLLLKDSSSTSSSPALPSSIPSRPRSGAWFLCPWLIDEWWLSTVAFS